MQPTHLLLAQTELAGRQPRNRSTVEASHEKYNLHQLCRPGHPHSRRRLNIAKHVLGISEHLPSLLLEGASAFQHSYGKPIKYLGGKWWRNAADSGGDVERILLAGRSLSKDDGGERVRSKPVGWPERFPLQVNRYIPSFNEGTKLL